MKATASFIVAAATLSYATDPNGGPSSTRRGQAEKCVPTVTVVEYAKPQHGCHVQCSTGFCIQDKFVTLPCGCTTADSVVTKTETICPTAPCQVCTTGFPFTTTADCPGTTGT
ncbi:hypothetical protein G6O67_006449 [Ophiocordyceps sinensis]|uniref:Uncharacterized protein n=1 Tax=Ophiocordyceps sinensis TaxID=72228 RepID=A0A8H4LVH9_9HYPO|nr:hypothetical protein G6O67_006449 [Ophiocordyceps sinensis]